MQGYPWGIRSLSYATPASNIVKPSNTRLWEPAMTYASPNTGSYSALPPQATMLPNFYYAPLFSRPASWLPAGPVQTASGPLAQSIPLSPLPELPKPEVLAPCVFSNHIPYGQAYGYNGNPNFYNYNYSPSSMWANSPAPQTPPLLPPAQPDNNQQTPPKEEPKKENPADKPIKDLPAITPELIQEINANLEASNYETRQNGARTLARMLEKDPDVLSKPQYAKYVEALILKVLKDPNSLVRQPLLLSMELGNLNSATPRIKSALNGLKNERGLYNFEPGIINGILSTLKSKEAESRQKQAEFANTPMHMPVNAPMTNLPVTAKNIPIQNNSMVLPKGPYPQTPFMPNSINTSPGAAKPMPGQRFNMMSS